MGDPALLLGQDFTDGAGPAWGAKSAACPGDGPAMGGETFGRLEWLPSVAGRSP